ncbi:MAG: phosphatidylserine decarboxylase [Candidatus Woesearchaeota archaeon]
MWLELLVLVLIFVVFLFFVFWRFYFLREPARHVPQGNNLVSPANGRVIKVFRFGKEKVDMSKGFGRIIDIARDVGDEGWIIVIFMSPFDVHVQRAPFSSKITKVKYTKGKFFNANEIQPENEKNEIVLQDITLKIKVIQVAGLIARRIECFVKERQEVLKGQRIGRINLGSQVIVVIPKNMNPKVKEGQVVIDGETIIAEF